MKLTIDLDDDWPEKRIRAGADDGSNDDEYDLLCAVGEAVNTAMRKAGMDMTAIYALQERRDNGDLNDAH